MWPVSVIIMYSNTLYCFVSHQSAVIKDSERLKIMCNAANIKDYLLVCGNSYADKIDNNILYLDCDDTYEGLPEKINRMFDYVSKNYTHYDYFGKLDRLTYIKEPLPKQLMSGDYCGSWVKVKDGFDGDRKWHFGKCSKGSVWNKKLYPGKFIPWCRGWAYFLSPKAAQIVGQNPPRSDYHIYEDLYVSETLLNYGSITPRNIKNFRNYIFDLESNF